MKVDVKEVGCESVQRMYLIQNISFHQKRVVCRAGSQTVSCSERKALQGMNLANFGDISISSSVLIIFGWFPVTVKSVITVAAPPPFFFRVIKGYGH
jgi:hypothetical protein